MKLGRYHKIHLYPSNLYTLDRVCLLLKDKERVGSGTYVNPVISDERYPRNLEGTDRVQLARFPVDFSAEDAIREIQEASLVVGTYDHWVGFCIDRPQLTRGRPVVALGSTHQFSPSKETRYPVAFGNRYYRLALLLAETEWDACYQVLVVQPRKPTHQ